MNNEKIHVYLMPGMAANSSIFENIKLPEETFQMHLLEWMIPNKKETLQAYAKRMTEKIEHDNVVLLGVSFGGILIQEMSKFITVRKLIVVSSVKSKYEYTTGMKFAKATKIYKVLPTRLVKRIDGLSKYAVSKPIKRRFELYKKYLSVNDKRYLDWAIQQVLCWEQEEANENAVYVYGKKDSVFSYSPEGNTIAIENGTHIMIIDKYKWFNKNLPKLMLS